MPPVTPSERPKQTAVEPTGAYLPALRWRALTPVFDPAVRLTTRERSFKRRLLERAAVAEGEAVLDLGCGTGTLAIELKERAPRAHVTALDADPEVLARARGKVASRAQQIDLVEALSTAMPFADARFDVVLSTLFFHHLDHGAKLATLREVMRVLRRGGRLHVADWGKPRGVAMSVLSLAVRAFDGFAVTAENAAGALPRLFQEAGFEGAALQDTLSTPLGTLALYAARKPV
jgi:ubiquinone/menaquinone biosynthesis C-methylase UbiE